MNSEAGGEEVGEEVGVGEGEGNGANGEYVLLMKRYVLKKYRQLQYSATSPLVSCLMVVVLTE